MPRLINPSCQGYGQHLGQGSPAGLCCWLRAPLLCHCPEQGWPISSSPGNDGAETPISWSLGHGKPRALGLCGCLHGSQVCLYTAQMPRSVPGFQKNCAISQRQSSAEPLQSQKCKKKTYFIKVSFPVRLFQSEQVESFSL